MSIFTKYRREWCADGCGRRILITRWHATHGHVCLGCYMDAVCRSERDEERRQSRGYLPEELERI